MLYRQHVLNHVSDRSSHLAGKCRKKLKIFSVRSVAVKTALSYGVIRGVFVLFTFAKAEVIWFDTLISAQSLALLHALHINNLRPNYWSQTRVVVLGTCTGT